MFMTTETNSGTLKTSMTTVHDAGAVITAAESSTVQNFLARNYDDSKKPEVMGESFGTGALVYVRVPLVGGIKPEATDKLRAAFYCIAPEDGESKFETSYFSLEHVKGEDNATKRVAHVDILIERHHNNDPRLVALAHENPSAMAIIPKELEAKAKEFAMSVSEVVISLAKQPSAEPDVGDAGQEFSKLDLTKA
jgi:hypothetical protein